MSVGIQGLGAQPANQTGNAAPLAGSKVRRELRGDRIIIAFDGRLRRGFCWSSAGSGWST